MAVLKKTADTEAPEEKKTAAKKTAAKKNTAAKKTTAPKKTSVKKLIDDAKDSAPKAAKKKTVKKKEPKVDIVVEYAGKQVRADEVIARISDVYTQANPDSVIETIELYIQPEKNVAYYVINKETGKNTKVKI